MNTENDFEKMLEAIRDGFQKEIPFHRDLGIKIEKFSTDEVCIRVDMKEELVGNVFQEILHGGVIAALLDIVGGVMSAVSIVEGMKGSSLDDIANRLLKVSTIDMRTDYIKPGKGKYFLAKGKMLRTGKIVAVARMELHNDEGVLIAVGTGTYKVG